MCISCRNGVDARSQVGQSGTGAAFIPQIAIRGCTAVDAHRGRSIGIVASGVDTGDDAR